MMLELNSSSYVTRYKRLCDVLVAASTLVIISPLLVVLALLVWLLLGGPVLFRQKRPGAFGTTFNMLKFRTMTEMRDQHGVLLSDGERLTNFGKLLRKTSLDELPELWNVLAGEMSLVGPRPLLMRYFPYFNEREQLRFTVRPGITGLAQIAGRNELSWDRRIELDLQYVSECSFLLDVKILLLTLLRVARTEGVRENPGAFMLDFDEERRRRGNAPHPAE